VSRGAFCPSCCRAAAHAFVLVVSFSPLVLAAREQPHRSGHAAPGKSRSQAVPGKSRDHAAPVTTPDIQVSIAKDKPLPAAQPLADARVRVPAAQIPGDSVFRLSRPVHNGPEYELGSEWSLFAGVTNTDARTPGMPRHWTGAGLGYRPSENWIVDFGFVHPYTNDTRFIDPLTASNPYVSGPSVKSQLFGLSGRYRFDFGGH